MNDVILAKKIKLKKISRIIIIAVVSLAVLLALLWVVSLFFQRDKIPTRVVDKSIRFSTVDYKINIFDDPVYVGKERNITYLEFGTGSIIGNNYNGDDEWHGISPASEYAKYCDEAVFFRNYFICLISGDYISYPEFFTDNFFNYYTIPEKFTMQKLYDITVELYNREEVDYNDEKAVIEQYIVSYRIMNNNASFRGDVGSDISKPLYFKMLKYNGEIKIEAITFIKEKKA
ncbi:MAG: hypothetical protein PHW77_00500 [Eubacteriales bacterium]|nr:hypothetical protein [Eubacteriales bacterium]